MPPAIDSDEFSKDGGVVKSQDERQAIVDAATYELLRSRLASKGPFLSHEEAERRILSAIED